MTGDTTRLQPGTGGAALVHKRCNPYGHETGGPKRLLGGLYGPESEGRYKWVCKNEAAGRYRASCRCGHRGQEMPLCGEHREEIQRRQMGLCPPCAWPPPALGIFEATKYLETALNDAVAAGDFQRVHAVQRQLESHGAALGELAAMGVVHRCALKLTEVS